MSYLISENKLLFIISLNTTPVFNDDFDYVTELPRILVMFGLSKNIFLSLCSAKCSIQKPEIYKGSSMKKCSLYNPKINTGSKPSI